MSKPKLTADEWLEWAQAKYEAAQERYAFGGSSNTMDSYAALVMALEGSVKSNCRIIGINGSWGTCNKCGALVNLECVAENDDMNYCPSCGREVVNL